NGRHQQRASWKWFASMFPEGGSGLPQRFLDVGVVVRLELLQLLARSRVNRRDWHTLIKRSSKGSAKRKKPKHQIPSSREFEVCNLQFPWGLEIGIWDTDDPSCRTDSFPRCGRFVGSFALEAVGIPISAPRR